MVNVEFVSLTIAERDTHLNGRLRYRLALRANQNCYVTKDAATIGTRSMIDG